LSNSDFELRQSDTASSPRLEKEQNLARAVYLLCQQATPAKLRQRNLWAKASISAVRYCNILPANFLFFQAGEAMENIGRPEAAIIRCPESFADDS
jgi:intraflagellar transport protein 172